MLEIVKYHNDLNTVPLRRFTEAEMNIFTAVVQQMRDKKTNQFSISFDRLKELIDWKSRKQSDADFMKYLAGVSQRIISLSGTNWSPDGKSFDVFVLFTWFHGDVEKQELEVSVNPKFSYILNDLGGHFTQYELSEYVSLSTTYSKSLYRILKQYRTTGFVKLPMAKFRDLIDVPKSYRPSEIDKHIFTKSTRIDLANAFHHLKINKVYGRTKGHPVLGYEFRFDPEKPSETQEDLESKREIIGK